MTERPIRRTAEQVRALLGGATQLRVPVKPPPSVSGADFAALDNSDPPQWWLWRGERDETAEPWEPLPKCPFGKAGDVLWVQETWRPIGPWETRSETVQYRVDETCLRKTGWPESFRIGTKDGRNKWRPSTTMPRWASRITLEVLRVWMERLNYIWIDAVLAEGIRGESEELGGFDDGLAFFEFMQYWDRQWAKRGYGYDTNPWVWCAEVARKR